MFSRFTLLYVRERRGDSLRLLCGLSSASSSHSFFSSSWIFVEAACNVLRALPGFQMPVKMLLQLPSELPFSSLQQQGLSTTQVSDGIGRSSLFSHILVRSYFKCTYQQPSSVSSRFDGADDETTRHVSAVTLPRLRPRMNTFRRPSLRAVRSNLSANSAGSIRAPDRFLPIRPSLDSAVESFRANKDPQTLSSDERLLRHKDASPDAFNARRHISSPVPRSNRPILERRNISGRRSGSGGNAQH